MGGWVVVVVALLVWFNILFMKDLFVCFLFVYLPISLVLHGLVLCCIILYYII